MENNKSTADLLIIGGGVFGNSIAFHHCLNYPGRRVVVLERNELNSAATSRAAAMITKVRAKTQFIPLAKRTYIAIREMEALLGESLGLRRNGILHVAASEVKVRELDQLIDVAGQYNESAEYIAAEEAEKMAPWLDCSTVFKIGYMPDEAYCDPYLLGSFYARSARLLGAEIRTGITAQTIRMKDNRVTGVETDHGYFEAENTIVASGAWAPMLAKTIGVELPMAPVRSQYWITKPDPLFPEASPMVVIPDVNAYFRPEGGSLLFGIREKKSLGVSPSRLPSELSGFEFSPDRGMRDLTDAIAGLAAFFPTVYDIGIQHYIAGFSSYTPDNYLSMGKHSQIEGLMFATGCVGAGIAVCGGVGHAFSEMAAGKPNPYDFSAFSLDRFGEIDSTSESWVERCAAARSVKNSG